jgi:phenylalanyl-tRNA synthetase alpha chain
MTDPASEHLATLKSEAENSLEQADTAAELETWRVKYLGRRGRVPQLLRGIKDLPAAQRRSIGQQGNELRRSLERQYADKAAQQMAKPGAKDHPAAAPTATEPGHLHPLTLTMRRVQAILSRLGFVSAEGPLVEEARVNFDQLNIPLDHPARAETDTYYIGADKVLRTSTSPVQIRSVQELGLRPPFRMFSLGRVFRAEKPDATHGHTFHQVEGLVLGADVTIADFKGVIEHFYSEMFSTTVTIRLRPHYFPFVEPGLEVDISCVFCRSEARRTIAEQDQDDRVCPVCKDTRWIEMMGAGMVHPNVIRNMTLNPAAVQGYAFGGGIDRLAMLLSGIDDIRLFWSGDLRFLRQFN